MVLTHGGDRAPVVEAPLNRGSWQSVLLGAVAYKSGEAIEWDSANLKVKNSEKAQALIHKEYRKGWVL